MRVLRGGRSTFWALVCGILLVFAPAFQTQAVPLTIGGTVTTPGTGSLGAGTILTNETEAFTSANFSGTIQLEVYKENGSGTLDFLFQIFNSSSSANAIERLTTTNFTGFATDVDWTNNAVIGEAPDHANRPSADVVGFNFLTTPVLAGTNSALLFIKTDATAYTAGGVSMIDGTTVTIPAFAPTAVPEPSSWALVVLSVAMATLVVRRRNSKAC